MNNGKNTEGRARYKRAFGRAERPLKKAGMVLEERRGLLENYVVQGHLDHVMSEAANEDAAVAGALGALENAVSALALGAKDALEKAAERLASAEAEKAWWGTGAGRALPQHSEASERAQASVLKASAAFREAGERARLLREALNYVGAACESARKKA